MTSKYIFITKEKCSIMSVGGPGQIFPLSSYEQLQPEESKRYFIELDENNIKLSNNNKEEYGKITNEPHIDGCEKTNIWRIYNLIHDGHHKHVRGTFTIFTDGVAELVYFGSGIHITENVIGSINKFNK